MQGLILILMALNINIINGNKNRLNTFNYSRVLNDIKPLIPKKEKNGLIKYSKKKLVLFIDKECSNNIHIKLFNHILNKYSECLYMINKEFGDNNDGIYYTDNDWFIFMELNNTIKCLNNNIINYKHYCISNFRYSKIYKINTYTNSNAICSKNKNTDKYGYVCYVIFIFIDIIDGIWRRC